MITRSDLQRLTKLTVHTLKTAGLPEYVAVDDNNDVCAFITVGKSLPLWMQALSRIVEIGDQVIMTERGKRRKIELKHLGVLTDKPVPLRSPDELARKSAATSQLCLFLARDKRIAQSLQSLASKIGYTDLTIGAELFVSQSLSGELDKTLPAPLRYIAKDIYMSVEKSDLAQTTEPLVETYGQYLSHFNPDNRQRFGVYYTPQTIVKHMVSAVSHLLTSEFGIGLPNCTIIDPACGTGHFLFELIQEIRADCDQVQWQDYVANIEHRLCGYEIMPVPAHLAEKRLAQTAGMTVPIHVQDALNSSIDTKRVTVVIGNPPYSGHSTNPSSNQEDIVAGSNFVAGWTIENGNAQPVMKTAHRNMVKDQPTTIGRLLKDYYICDGNWLREANTKWLQDDYVKFIRWSQWQIERAGKGILAFITNHAFLDNPTFRGMRYQLAQAFSDIYVINLHGNLRQGSTEHDQNVLGISQGVCIIVCVLNGDKNPTVHYCSKKGTKQAKLAFLSTPFADINWKTSTPQRPDYLFVPETRSVITHKTVRLTEIMPLHSAAIVTGRDSFCLSMDKGDLMNRLERFCSLDPEKARSEFELRRDSRDWQVALAQQDVQSSGINEDRIVQVLYRPFDVRWMYYTGRSRGVICMPRRKVTDVMVNGSNVALITVRRVPPHAKSCYVFASKLPVISGCIRSDNQSIDTVFPLYREDGAPNLDPSFVQMLSDKAKQSLNPNHVLGYIYAVMNADWYAKAQMNDLYRDFPRIPLLEDSRSLLKLSTLGRRLISAHTVRGPNGFCGGGCEMVEPGFPEYMDKSVYVNADGYRFKNIECDVYEYEVGAYRPAEKWLKDRRRLSLSQKDIDCYESMVSSIKRSVELINQINTVTGV